MDAWRSDSSFSNLAKISDFAERIGYDANDNILEYQRNGNNTFAGKPPGMDSLTYSYQSGTNQLDHINDAVNASNYTEDIDDQSVGNYNYDAIGNLVKDNAGGITTISWTVYGKIDSITKTNGSTIKYLYDAAGKRISKTVKQGAITSTTGYVRDASGNVMSVYMATDTTNNGHLMQSEVDLYGSSRLGIWKPGIDVDYLTPATDTPGQTHNAPALTIW